MKLVSISIGSAPLVTLYIELLISSVTGASHVTCICSTNETTKGQETTSFGVINWCFALQRIKSV